MLVSRSFRLYGPAAHYHLPEAYRVVVLQQAENTRRHPFRLNSRSGKRHYGACKNLMLKQPLFMTGYDDFPSCRQSETFSATRAIEDSIGNSRHFSSPPIIRRLASRTVDSRENETWGRWPPRLCHGIAWPPRKIWKVEIMRVSALLKEQICHLNGRCWDIVYTA